VNLEPELLDIAIVGAGPAGLATAIAAVRRQLSYQILEKGALVNSLLHYPKEMVFFTTPELMEVGGMPFVSPYDKPTRVEALRYYRRVTDAFALDVAFEEAVRGIARETADPRGPFAVDTESARGARRRLRARTVVIATGAYDFPNRLGVPGEDLPHVSHYYTEPHPFFRRHVVIVGGKNSAAEAALDLFRAGARVTIVHRGAALGDSIKYWVKPDIENRIREGSIAARFDTRVVEIRPAGIVVERGGDVESLVRSAGVGIDPETCGPTFDPETFETNVPGLYVAGAVVAGKQSGRIFIENGRFHGEQVVAGIVKRLAA
jgi:bacillithiol disulfide reductase